MTDLSSSIAYSSSPNSHKRIWILNPFDQLPNETDVPLRYWSLCKAFATQGHEVTWWSSDFSHLTKAKRAPCPDTDGFRIRLIETPPYTKNISFARLRNHKAFARNFYRDAMVGLKSGELPPPDRIVVSLPPLGVAEQAFRIRDYVLKTGDRSQKSARDRETPVSPQAANHSHSTTTSPCEVIVDIMDAWPETFYRAFPKWLSKSIKRLALSPMHLSAQRAYQGADKISAVGQSYLDLAKRYLNQRTEHRGQTPDEANVGARLDAPATEPTTKEGSAAASRSAQPSPQSSVIDHQSSRHRRPSAINHPAEGDHQSSQATPAKPMMLCYHGTDLERFAQKPEQGSAAPSRSVFTTQPSVINHPAKGDHQSSTISHQPSLTSSAPSAISHLAEGDHQSSAIHHQSSTAQPLHAVYLGSMGQGYDLMTILKVAARWKAEGTFPFQIHFAGTGDQLEQLKNYAAQEGLLAEGRDQRTEDNDRPSAINHQSSVIDDSGRIVFHGFLQKNEINELLLSSDIALVANKPDSLVACPYKAGEYAAAGLPMISCLDGELNELLAKWHAGCRYKQGDVDSLYNAFEGYDKNLELLMQHRQGSFNLARSLFDRKSTYKALADFIRS